MEASFADKRWPFGTLSPPLFGNFHVDCLCIWICFRKLLLYHISILSLKCPLMLAVSPYIHSIVSSPLLIPSWFSCHSNSVQYDFSLSGPSHVRLPFQWRWMMEEMRGDIFPSYPCWFQLILRVSRFVLEIHLSNCSVWGRETKYPSMFSSHKDIVPTSQNEPCISHILLFLFFHQVLSVKMPKLNCKDIAAVKKNRREDMQIVLIYIL